MIGLPAYVAATIGSECGCAADLWTWRSDHISDALISIHWLRIPERIKFKVAVLTYKVHHGRRISDHLPSWLTYLVAVISDPLAPAASFNHWYVVPPSAGELFWLLALSVATVRYLPSALEDYSCRLEVTSVPSLEIFRKRL